MYIVTFCFSFPLVTISRPSSDGTIWKCQSRITRSIKIARGQLDGVLRMIEEDRYCVPLPVCFLVTAANSR